MDETSFLGDMSVGGSAFDHGVQLAASVHIDRPKLSRASVACAQCRARRRKCSGSPPAPCRHCSELRIACRWPAKDSRPKRGRPPRDRSDTFASTRNRSESQSTEKSRDHFSYIYFKPTEGDEMLGARGMFACSPVSGMDERVTAGSSEFSSTLTGSVANSQSQAQPHFAGTSRTIGGTILDDIVPEALGPMSGAGIFGDVTLDPVTSEPAPVKRRSVQTRTRSVAALTWEHGLLVAPSEDQSFFLELGDPSDCGLAATLTQATGRSKRSGGWTSLDEGLPFSLFAPHQDFGAITTGTVTDGSSIMTLDARGCPLESTVVDVLKVWSEHLENMYPFFSSSHIKRLLKEDHSQSTFVFDAVAALSARFLLNEDSGSPGLSPPPCLGFYHRALTALGANMDILSRESVGAFVLLSVVAYGEGKETNMRMLNGLAVRMSIEMGLHMATISTLSSEDDRLDILTFWAVLIQDYSIAIFDGTQMSLAPSEVTARLPTQEDMYPDEQNATTGDTHFALRSPYPFLAQLMLAIGGITPEVRDDIISLVQKISTTYETEVPLDMLWTSANMQWHYRGGTGPAFFMYHVWNFAVRALRYLVIVSGVEENDQAVASLVAEPWLAGARFVSEMLVLANIIDPKIHIAVPMLGHAFYIAEYCFLNDISWSSQPTPASSAAWSDVVHGLCSPSSSSDIWQTTRSQSRNFLMVIAVQNITTLRQALCKQALYWPGLRNLISKFDRRLAKAQATNDVLESIVTGKMEPLFAGTGAKCSQRTRSESRPAFNFPQTMSHFAGPETGHERAIPPDDRNNPLFDTEFSLTDILQQFIENNSL